MVESDSIVVSVPQLRAALKSASKDSIRRPEMVSILIHPEGIVATDGHRMFIGDHVVGTEWPTAWAVAGLIVPRKLVEGIVKGIGDASVTVHHVPGSGRVRMVRGVVDGSTDLLSDDYPPFQKVVPPTSVFRWTCTPRYLQDLAAAAHLLVEKERPFGDMSSSSVELTFVDGKTTMVATTSNSQHGKNRQFLMPIFTEDARSAREAGERTLGSETDKSSEPTKRRVVRRKKA